MEVPLATIGHRVYRLLDEIANKDFQLEPPSEDAQSLAAIIHEGQRFRVWAVSLGLLVPGHGSLDYRVREADSLARTLRSFLDDLVESLEEVLEYEKTDGEAAEPEDVVDAGEELSEHEEDGDDDSSILTVLLESIRDVVYRLMRLSTKLRNPSTRLRSSKAQQFQLLDDGVDLFDQYRRFDLDHVRSVFQQLREGPSLLDDDSDSMINSSSLVEHYLVKRITQANVMRRRQFAYWRHHRLKLEQHTDLAVRALPQKQEPRPFLAPSLRADIPMPAIAPPMSISTATQLHPKLVDFEDIVSTISVSEYRPSPTLGADEVVFPPPPDLKASEKFFECPFCLTTCDRRTSSINAWRAHLIHDLRPYICTYESCKTASQVYDNKAEWIQHEALFHQSSTDHPGRRDLVPSAQKTSQEVSNQHLTPNASQPGSGGGQVHPNAERVCPICNVTITHATGPQNHIATHLERLALFSLPRSTGSDKDDEGGSNNADYEGNDSQADMLGSDLTRTPTVSPVRSDVTSPSAAINRQPPTGSKRLFSTKLASCSMYGTVHIWDRATRAAVLTLEVNTSWLGTVAFSPDGRQLASESADRTVGVWDSATGEVLQMLEGHTGTVNAVAFSPGGKQLASGSDDNTVRVWDLATGMEVLMLEGHSSGIYAVAFSPDGRQLASGSADDTVRVWNSATGEVLQMLEGHTYWLKTVAFSPDGRQLASGSADGTVRVWDPATGKAVLTLEGHSNWLKTVAFSPDGKQLASGSDDSTARVWDSATGEVLQMLEGHTGTVNAVAFSPDGKQLASGSDDNTVRVWDPATGTALHTLEGHTDPVSAVAFLLD